MASSPSVPAQTRFDRVAGKIGWAVLTALLALVAYSFWATRDNGPEFFSDPGALIIADVCILTAYLTIALVVWIAIRAFYEGWTKSDSTTDCVKRTRFPEEQL